MTASSSPVLTVVTFAFLTAEESAAMGNPVSYLKALSRAETEHAKRDAKLRQRWSLLARQTREAFESTCALLLTLEMPERERAYKRIHEACESCNAPHQIASRKAKSEVYAVTREQARILSDDEKAKVEAKVKADEAEREAQAAKQKASTIAAIEQPLREQIATLTAIIAERDATIAELRAMLALVPQTGAIATDKPRSRVKAASVAASVAA